MVVLAYVLFLFLMSSLSVFVLVSIRLSIPLLFFHSLLTMTTLNMRAKATMQRMAVLCYECNEYSEWEHQKGAIVSQFLLYMYRLCAVVTPM